MTLIRRFINLLIWISAVVLMGCNTNKPHKSVIPQEGPTMAQIYGEQLSDADPTTLDGLRAQVLSYDRGVAKGELKGYTTDQVHAINNHFKRLADPDIVLYVDPHVSGAANVPVPGYTTVIPLYDTVNTALVGEE